MEPERFLSRESGEYFFDGLKIWTEWKLPIPYQDFADIFWKNRNEKKIDKMYKTILELNPELIKMNVKYQDYKYFIAGIISQFNFDDIEFFLYYGTDYNTRNPIMEEYLEIIRILMIQKIPHKIKAITNTGDFYGADDRTYFPNYIISPKTCKKIIKYLKSL